jgi:flagellar hook-associated protein 3 FlgL
MTERITNQMAANTLMTNIDNDLDALDNTQNQLSTGLLIQEPSDNPYGAGLSLSLDSQISAIQDYNTNITDGTAWTQTASAALNSIYQMGTTVQTQVVEARSGTEQQDNLDDIAAEVAQLTDAIKEAADTQLNGNFIFAGTATTTQPYAIGAGSADTYNGNNNTISRAIGPGSGSQVVINANLAAVLGSGGTDGLMLSTLNQIQTDLTSGNTTDLGTQLTNLQGNLAQLASLQAQVGTTQDRIQMASTRLQSLQTTDEQELSGVQDVDMSSATIEYSTQQAGYEAALQTGAELVKTSLLSFLNS